MSDARASSVHRGRVVSERELVVARSTAYALQAHARAVRARLERALRVRAGALEALAFCVRLVEELASAQDAASRALGRWSRLTEMDLCKTWEV